MKNIKFRRFAVIIAFLVLLLASCNFVKENVPANADAAPNEENEGDKENENENATSDYEDKENITENTDENKSTIEEAEDNNTATSDNDENNNKVVDKPSEKPTKPNKTDNTHKPSGNGNGGSHVSNNTSQKVTGQAADPYINDSSLVKKWQALDEIASAGQTYYTENFSKTRVITKNGYLYNKASEEFIDVRYLVSNGYLSSQYVSEKCDILLMDISDVKKYDGLYIKDSEEGLMVIAAMPHPSENVYLLTTSKSAGGAISSAQYAAILNNYYQNHGSIGRLSPTSEDYDRILNFISMYESKYEDYFVRSITIDNKYAVVVLSGQSNPADVKQYILRRSGSIWEVVMSNLESDPRVLISVNKELPDFNLDLLPAYTINDHLSSLSRDKSQVIGEMIGKGLISGASDINYICGTANFIYIVLDNEVKYICNNTGDSWNIVQVSTSDEAMNKMLSISKNAPTFIILDR